MDKKLLDALNNLSDALEQIASALKNKGGDKSATTEALQAGNFGGSLTDIVAGIKSIKMDTQEILRQQRTIMGMSRQKEEKKTEMFESAGSKKSESGIKKGVGTILLIAVAVLAIGTAFKLVGNINFLSVIGLSLAMLVMAEAFVKVASVAKGLSMGAIFRTTIAMVGMSMAIMLSSKILSKVTPTTIMQAITARLIVWMFSDLGQHMAPLFEAASGIKRLNPLRLLLSMVAISAGIAASSAILRYVMPVSPIQLLTALLVAGMFALMSLHFERLAAGFAILDKANVRKREIILFMTGMAAGIAASSLILSTIKPMGLMQFLTGIAIAAMFAVMSLHFERLAIGISVMRSMKVKARHIVMTLVGISIAIMASSVILSGVVPITLVQFLTAFGIAVLFAMMSFVMPMLAAGIVAMDKILGSKKMLVVLPLVFIAISIAIMASSYILSMAKQMEYSQILNLAIFGITLAIIVTALMPAVLAVGIAVASGVGALAILGGAAMIPVIAAAIAVSSHIISQGDYKGNYPGLGWALGVGLSMIEFSAAVLALGIIAITGVGALALVAGLVAVPLVAQAIVETARVIGTGKYDKYPGAGWALTVTPLMLVFATMVVALGVLIVGTLGLGGLAIKAGLESMPWIAQSIVNTARVIGTGKYDKYPGPGWALTVAPLMLVFAGMVVSLGVISILGYGLGALAILAGLKWIPSIAWSIVQTANVIGKGKYDKYPGAEWAISVGGLMVAFAGMIVTVGGLIVASFGLGNVMLSQGIKAVKMIARSIVSVAWIFSNSRAAFKNGPPKEWAEGIKLAMGAFSPVFKMLLMSGVVEAIFGSKVTPEQYSEAIKTISRGIVDAAKYFGSKEANVAFEGGPSKEWSEGVGKAIGAFAPVYKMLVKGGIMEVFTGKGPSIWGYVNAIKAISRGIVASAKIFAESKTTFDSGYPDAKWGKGVGSALSAFAPVLAGMKESSWFESDDEQINQMIRGIKKMTYAIVKVGYIFTSAKSVDWTAYPDKKWGSGIKSSFSDFLGLAEKVTDSSSVSSGWEVVSLAKSLSAVARVLTKNRMFFGAIINIDRFVKDTKLGLIRYMSLAYLVKKRKNLYWRNLGSGGDDFMLAIAESFVDFSKAIARGRGSFGTVIDPNFMKNIHGNVLYYARIVDMLQSPFGSVGDRIEGFFSGGNVMKPLADGMIMLANAFDRIATSLGKFSAVISTLDEKKMTSITTFGAKVMAGSKPQGFLSSIGSAIGSVVQSAGDLVSGGIDRAASFISPKAKTMAKVERGKYGTQQQQMDRLIELMIMIVRDTKVVKQYMDQKLADMDVSQMTN